MKIKKTDQYVAFSEVETIHVFDVNGKKVRVSHFVPDGQENDDVGNDVEVLENHTLTSEEYEALGLDLSEHLEMKEGEEKEVDEEINPDDIPF